ncbi:hypothetical protein [Octadecabacter temperatus]|nr:hypothetical protein [Octadecabacter temperatus]
MFKNLALSALTLSTLAACETPAPGVTITPEALERVDSITAETVAPSVSPATAITTFDAFCGRFPANPAGTRAAVQANGYFLMATASFDGLEMWASENGAPLVALGNRDGAKVCMIMLKEGRDLSSAISNYVQQKHGGSAVNIGEMQFGADTAENVFVVPNAPPVIYFSLVQAQPGLGRVEAIATVTE